MVIRTLPLPVIKILTGGFDAFTFNSVIYTSKGKLDDVKLINHESIHAAQQNEMGMLAFLKVYLGDYFKRVWELGHYDAYRNIRLEQEAWDNEYNIDYLETRVPFAWKHL